MIIIVKDLLEELINFEPQTLIVDVHGIGKLDHMDHA
jgi:hypothetical protein